LRQTLKPPFEIVQVVVFNMALVLAGWFLLSPDDVTNARFASLVFLPAVLASWAFSDVPTTNLYGSQPRRALAALGDTTRLRNLIMARDLTLWLLVAPGTAMLSFILAYDDQDLLGSAIVASVVVITPFASLGIGAIMAPLLPYHPIRLSQRRQLRATWARWIVAVCLPYLLIGPATVVVLLPAMLLLEWQGKSNAVWLAAVLMTLGWTMVVRRVSVDAAIRLTHNREDRLRAYLSDPTRG
jgi:hypothetical protein